MVLLNFGFTGIQVAKGKTTKGKLNVKSGMNITDVQLSKAIQEGDQVPFQITFKYTVDYQPSNGFIKLEGGVLYLAGKELASAIKKSWEEKKTLPKDLAVPVYNRILHNCTVEALLFSREVGLPAPLQLPKLTATRNQAPVEEPVGDAPVKKMGANK